MSERDDNGGGVSREPLAPPLRCGRPASARLISKTSGSQYENCCPELRDAIALASLANRSCHGCERSPENVDGVPVCVSAIGAARLSCASSISGSRK